MKKILYAMFLLVFTVSCAGRVGKGYLAPHDAHVISGVPVYDDTGHQCGPASLAAVISYWQKKAGAVDILTAEEVGGEIYSSEAEGTLCIDMVFYAGSKGYDASQYAGTEEDLRENVRKENPVIILVDLGFSVYQRNHYMVVTGYTGDGIIAYSGAEEITISYDRLERIWKKTGYWTLLVRPSR
ncbi:MAG: C39 family peptidase [Nitrospirota bacterium]|nr:C39 family peptidase [Nitrospirota bacterium]